MAWSDDAEATGLFLEHGATPDERYDGETPFLYAYRLRRFKAANTLLSYGADINAPDGNGNTAVHLAIMKGFSVADTKLLVEAGADPSRSNGDGKSAIQMAEGLCRRGVLRLLNGRA